MSPTHVSPKRIVLCALGSHGDLHPALAVGKSLRRRGHSVALATDLRYRGKVEADGLEFARLRPGADDFGSVQALYAKINRLGTGTEFIIRDMILPWLEQSAEDLLVACKGADLLVSHPIAYAAPAVAEKLRIPWVGTALQPIVFMSAEDPPVLPQARWLQRMRGAGPAPFRLVNALGRALTSRWMRPVKRLRSSWGLPPGAHPLFGGLFSPHLNLALFSRVLAEPKADWPEKTRVTGFPFHDEEGPFEGEPALDAFLSAGTAPVLFTLGTTAVLDPGRFYEESLAAVEALGKRAVFLVGAEPAHRPLGALPASVMTLGYVPFARLMPRACAIVHQGGVGTTGQALRSGRPQVVVPWANDQPDNAARVARLGAGLTLSRRGYRKASVMKALEDVLSAESIRASAERAGASVRAECGAEAASDAIESLLPS